MAKLPKLPQEVLDAIDEYFKKDEVYLKCKQDYIIGDWVRGVDVFDVLKEFSYVVFYPLDDNNDGFHLKKPIAGEMKDFVYINTKKSLAKQVFTAAHEFGHIINVDTAVERILQNNGSALELNLDMQEQIISRFASEILMPKEAFKKHYNVLVKESDIRFDSSNNGEIQITLYDLLKIILSLMWKYTVTRDAVIIRLYEVGAMPKESVDVLFDDDNAELINKTIDQLAEEKGYTSILNETNVKTIEGLSELLKQEDVIGVVNESKLNKLRELFEIKEISDDAREVTISNVKGE